MRRVVSVRNGAHRGFHIICASHSSSGSRSYYEKKALDKSEAADSWQASERKRGYNAQRCSFNYKRIIIQEKVKMETRILVERETMER